MNPRIKTIILIVAVVVIALFVLYFTPKPAAKQQVATVAYSCNDAKGIIATFYKGETAPTPAPGQPPTPTGSVALTLSDGRTMTLKQTISADGGRYANTDESFVFWGKGNGALVLEDNQQKSYIGCIVIAPEPSGVSLPLTYSNSSAGFSIRLAQGYSVDEAYKYQELGPGKDIYGIKFTIPANMATGTNLASDTYVSVEGIPKTQNCTASLFLDRAKAYMVSDGDSTYSIATSTGAAAGNRYEQVVYAFPGTNPCIAMRYFVHYGVFENYPPGSVQQFSGPALGAQFDAIRRTIIIVQ